LKLCGLKLQGRGDFQKSLYLAGHYSIADFSTLSYFDEFKNHLDHVKGSVCTVLRPFTKDSVRISFRDSMMLTPAERSSLADLGKLYNFPKLEPYDKSSLAIELSKVGFTKENDKHQRYNYKLSWSER
jgi:hypothetical protein